MRADYSASGFREPRFEKAFEVGSPLRTDTRRAPRAGNSRARRNSALLAGCVIAAGTLLPSAGFAMDVQSRFAGLQSVDDRQLGDMRGGFSVAGVDFSFGALITTVVDGVVVLQTQLVPTSAGLVPTTVQSNSVPDTTISVSNSSSGPATQTMTIAGQTGTTVTTATVDGQRVVNAVISSGAQQNVSQQIQFDVQLNNFTSIAGQIAQNQLSSEIASSVEAALLAGTPH